MLSDGLLIVFISCCTALLGEGLTWILVYRTDTYKRLLSEVEKLTKRVEKKKENTNESLDKSQKKRLEREEDKLKSQSRELSFVKMKSMLAIGFVFTALLSMFSSIFEGHVVAKLPFVPLSFFQNLSHRNLSGDDPTDCAFIFLYILSTMSLRQNLQKLLGVAPSRSVDSQNANFWQPPSSVR